MGRIVRRPKAKADLKAIHAWIAQNSIAAASAYIRKINAAILRISDNPLSAPRRLESFPDVRIACIENHILIYRPLEPAKGVEILRILHAAQDWFEHPEIH